MEETRKVRRGLEKALTQAQTTIQDRNHTIQTQAQVLQAKEEEIARLKALLAETPK